MTTDEAEAFCAKRNAALAAMDMDYLRSMMPGASSDDMRLVAGHKARYEIVTMDTALRHESREWLESRGLSRMNGDWPPKGELPQ